MKELTAALESLTPCSERSEAQLEKLKSIREPENKSKVVAILHVILLLIIEFQVILAGP